MARTATLAAVVASCALAGLSFVPGLPTCAPASARRGAASQGEARLEAGRPVPVEEGSATWSLPLPLLGGVALGLLLSVASAGPAFAEEAKAPELTDEQILAKGCDIRVDCKTKEEQFRWAKAYYRKYNRESDGKDPKYAAASTGAGVYRKFKLDWPIINQTGIPDTTDGTYPIRPEAVAFQPVWEEYNKKIREKFVSVYGEPKPVRFSQSYYDDELSPYKNK